MSDYQITANKLHDLATKLVNLHTEIVSLGMVRTAIELNKAVKEIGWESELILFGNHPLTKLICEHGHENFDDCPDCGH